MEAFVHALVNITKILQIKIVFRVIILVNNALPIHNAHLVILLISDMLRFHFHYVHV
jgi:hypothetical protein